MTDDHPASESRVGLAAVAAMLSAATLGGTVAAFTGSAFGGAMWVVVTETPLLVAVLVSAGGFGWEIVRALTRRDGPGLLRLATAVALGLALLSTGVMLAGALLPGGLSGWVWWPVLAVGVALAARRAAPVLRRNRPAEGAPAGRGRLWLTLLAVPAGMWLAGATLPAGFASVGGDGYDVLEYHLQLPREFLRTGNTAPVSHNVYSHYPLGLEMLYLLAMILRGGAYEGMYLAKLLHGATGALAVAGMLSALTGTHRPRRDADGSPGGDETSGQGASTGPGRPPEMGLAAGAPPDGYAARIAPGVLLATSPILLYLSWMAMVELAQVMYLATAIAWIGRRPGRAGWRRGVLVGLLAGAACGTKYLAAGLVAAPALGMLALVSGLGDEGRWSLRRSAWPVSTACLACLALWAPWGVRNAVAVGNPVFPLATGTFGRGYFSALAEQRWVDGHSPEKHPPVPVPRDWTPPDNEPNRAWLAVRRVLSPGALGRLGPGLVVLGLVGAMVVLGSANRRSGRGAGLVGVLVVQVGLWVALAHGLPQRFLAPALVPLTLLAGEAVALVAARAGPLGRALSWALPACGCVAGLAGSWLHYDQAERWAVHGVDGARVARAVEPDVWALPAGSRVMLVGQATAFYMPPGTIYATTFDPHPLAEMARRGLSGEAMRAALEGMGVTHVLVHRREIARLRNSYGYPLLLSTEVASEALGGPIIAALAPLVELGLRPVKPTMTPTPGRTLYALPKAPSTAGTDGRLDPPR